jgi:hypothetical protein
MTMNLGFLFGGTYPTSDRSKRSTEAFIKIQSYRDRKVRLPSILRSNCLSSASGFTVMWVAMARLDLCSTDKVRPFCSEPIWMHYLSWRRLGSLMLAKSELLGQDGLEHPVIYACGHDMHTAVMMATASLLVSAKGSWNRTVIFILKPSEEAGGGAAGVVADGLYDKVPVPDVVLGQHVGRHGAGTVCVRSGPALTGTGSYHVKIFGKGGHAGLPHLAVSPISIGARVVDRSPQIITSRVAA